MESGRRSGYISAFGASKTVVSGIDCKDMTVIRAEVDGDADLDGRGSGGAQIGVGVGVGVKMFSLSLHGGDLHVGLAIHSNTQVDCDAVRRWYSDRPIWSAYFNGVALSNCSMAATRFNCGPSKASTFQIADKKGGQRSAGLPGLWSAECQQLRRPHPT